MKPNSKPPVSRTLQQWVQARGPLPTLMVMGDALATRRRLLAAAEAAEAGDNGAALALGRITQNPLLLALKPDDKAQAIRQTQIPPDLRDDSLYWLELAADRGDPVAQVTYANTVTTAARWKANPNHAVDSAALAQAEVKALAYLQSAVAAGVADGLKMLSAAHQEGRLGLTPDPAKAHAALLRLEASLPNPETHELVTLSQARLSVDHLTRAHQLAASVTWRVGN